MAKTKVKQLPRFRMKAEYVASFPHPHRDGPHDEITLRFIISVEGEHDEALRENGYFYAKDKMQMLGLKPLSIEMENQEYFVITDNPYELKDATRWYDSEEQRTKDVKARIYVPENKAESIELYGEPQKHPNMIRSVSCYLREPGERWSSYRIETLSGAVFKYSPTSSGNMPKIGLSASIWMPLLEPSNELAAALKAEVETQAANVIPSANTH